MKLLLFAVFLVAPAFAQCWCVDRGSARMAREEARRARVEVMRSAQQARVAAARAVRQARSEAFRMREEARRAVREALRQSYRDRTRYF